jgi:hypothetical protein
MLTVRFSATLGPCTMNSTGRVKAELNGKVEDEYGMATTIRE